MVLLRRWLIDLFDQGESPLLHDIDGENGLLANIVSHGAFFGILDKRPALHEIRENIPGGGGASRQVRIGGRPALLTRAATTLRAQEQPILPTESAFVALIRDSISRRLR